MGQTAQGGTLANPMMSLVNILKPDTMSEVDRFRLILIFILTQGRRSCYSTGFSRFHSNFVIFGITSFFRARWNLRSKFG